MAIGKRQRYANKTAESNLAQTAKAIKVAALPAAAPPVALSIYLSFSSPSHLLIASLPLTYQVCVCPAAWSGQVHVANTYLVRTPPWNSLQIFHLEFSQFFTVFCTFIFCNSFPVRVLINFLSNSLSFNGKCVGKNIFTTCIQISLTQCMWPDNLLFAPLLISPHPSPSLQLPLVSVAGILGLTCGMTMPRATNHSHNFKTISNCATSSTSFSFSPLSLSPRIPAISSSACSSHVLALFGFSVFCFFDFCVSRATGQTQMLHFGYGDPGIRDRRQAAVERVLRLYGQIYSRRIIIW